jgi:lipopolysaccharide transport system permease protein
VTPPLDVLVIEPGLRERHYWRDLWRYRELFYVLAWRDVAVRYKQTFFGIAWALLRPLTTMAVFTVVFSRIASLPSAGAAPYALMVFAGLLPWQFFSTALTESSGSLTLNSHLISKVYFPRLVVPTAAVVISFVDLAVSLVSLAGLMVWYRFVPGWQILTLPFFAAMAFLASLGPGLLITSLNVKYRDFQVIVPFIVQLGLFISPVGFRSSIVPERWRLLYSVNPLVGVIDGFRWAILGGQADLDAIGFAMSWAVIVILLWAGLRYFRRTEKTFADLV